MQHVNQEIWPKTHRWPYVTVFYYFRDVIVTMITVDQCSEYGFSASAAEAAVGRIMPVVYVWYV